MLAGSSSDRDKWETYKISPFRRYLLSPPAPLQVGSTVDPTSSVKSESHVLDATVLGSRISWLATQRVSSTIAAKLVFVSLLFTACLVDGLVCTDLGNMTSKGKKKTKEEVERELGLTEQNENSNALWDAFTVSIDWVDAGSAC